MSNAGFLIKKKRKEKKLTLEEVANHVGLSKSTLSKYENNHLSNMKRDKLIALCQLLELNPIDVLNGEITEIKDKITVDNFKTQLNYLLYKTVGLTDTEKRMIKDYVGLICTKGN